MGYNRGKEKMKKTMALLIAVMMVVGSLYANQSNSVMPVKTEKSISMYSDSNSGLVFRGIQKVRASDGAEIYLYPNSNVQMYDSDGRLVAECTYEWDGATEIFFKVDGKILYKGKCKINDQKQLTSLTLAGVTYWKKS